MPFVVRGLLPASVPRKAGLLALAAIMGGWGGWTVPAKAQLAEPLRGAVDENILFRNSSANAGDTAEAQSTGGIPAPRYRPFDAGDGAADAADGGEVIFDEPLPIDDPVLETGVDAGLIAEPEAVRVPDRAIATGAIGAVQGGTGQSDAQPFGAVGIRLGTFTLRPVVELGLTGQMETDTVVSGTSVSETTRNSVLADGALRLNLASDWNRHSLTVDANGRWERSLDGNAEIEPRFDVDATGRFDLGEATTLTGSAGYSYFREDPQSSAFFAATDPALLPPVTAANKPATQSLDGSLGLRHDFGALYGEIGGSIERTTHGDARLSDASVISQGDLDDIVYDGRLRAGFDASAVFSPFVEAGYGIRRMDTTPDSGGVDRNATRYLLRAGTEFDFGEKLGGEVSAGYLREDIADSALADISGLSVNAAIDWSPRRETDISLDLSTSTETSGSVSESGAVLYAADLAVTHRIRANLTAELSGGLDYRDVRGGADEFTASGRAGYTYWFNRFAGMTTRVGYEQTFSSDAADRSRTLSAFAGLRLQR